MAAPEIIHSSEDPLFDDVRERGHNVIFILACFRHWQCFRVRRLCLRIFDSKIHKMARNIYVQIALDLTSLLIGKFWTFVYLNRILLLMLVNKLSLTTVDWHSWQSGESWLEAGLSLTFDSVRLIRMLWVTRSLVVLWIMKVLLHIWLTDMVLLILVLHYWFHQLMMRKYTVE